MILSGGQFAAEDDETRRQVIAEAAGVPKPEPGMYDADKTRRADVAALSIIAVDGENRVLVVVQPLAESG